LTENSKTVKTTCKQKTSET